jgi:ribosomal protein RSM22 (predicted rRNA methylase)
MQQTLTDQEYKQRVAVLKRFREMLVTQREKFSSYLDVLERQRDDIKKGDADAMVAHAEIEQSIVSEIFTFQKVINPLEDMYKSAYKAAEMPEEIARIQENLDELKTEVLKRNQENQVLLKQRLGDLRQEIRGLRVPYGKANNVYGSVPAPSLVDISG